MKKDIGFRFSEETHEILLALSKEWNCTRTAVIERALRSSARHAAVHMIDDPKVLPKDPKEVEKVVARVTVPGDKSEGRKTSPPPSADSKMRVLTREERDARTAEFQRKMVKK